MDPQCICEGGEGVVLLHSLHSAEVRDVNADTLFPLQSWVWASVVEGPVGLSYGVFQYHQIYCLNGEPGNLVGTLMSRWTQRFCLMSEDRALERRGVLPKVMWLVRLAPLQIMGVNLSWAQGDQSIFLYHLSFLISLKGLLNSHSSSLTLCRSCISS